MPVLKKIIKVLLLISIILFVYSYFRKDNLPGKGDILDQLYQEPIQTETDAAPFTKEKGGIVYNITPIYNYELYGLVVSYHHSKSWFDYYHEKWKDFINIKDVCVIWGNNIETEVYKEMKFNSGSWTCYFKFKSGTSQEVWSKFKNDSGSNNHLLSDIEEVNEMIMNVEEGDQVYLKGYLVEYSSNEGFRRGTSVTRTDTGNGACETIYVTDLQIIKKANPLWHSIYSFSKYSIIACFVILLLLFFKPIRPLNRF